LPKSGVDSSYLEVVAAAVSVANATVSSADFEETLPSGDSTSDDSESSDEFYSEASEESSSVRTGSTEDAFTPVATSLNAISQHDKMLKRTLPDKLKIKLTNEAMPAQ
jgi:hypothetical protein